MARGTSWGLAAFHVSVPAIRCSMTIKAWWSLIRSTSGVAGTGVKRRVTVTGPDWDLWDIELASLPVEAS